MEQTTTTTENAMKLQIWIVQEWNYVFTVRMWGKAAKVTQSNGRPLEFDSAEAAVKGVEKLAGMPVEVMTVVSRVKA